ncbi:MAG TPA: polysaccharide deacetylase family protein [Candidatus Binatia bacterium]|nr:polysaccharide deacetylase family protein [Candidatus Binatia bacterium]
MKSPQAVFISAFFLVIFSFSFPCSAQKLAITFDDLPSNGELPPGVTRAQTAKDVLAILKKRHLPPTYGFINAKKLEGSPDGAEALRLWAEQEPVGNHTYSHMDLEQNSAEAFERDIELNEPALELLTGKGDWHWLRYPYLHEGDTVEKRRAVRSYLSAHHYRIAQVTLDYEDYLWNFTYARCVAKGDQKAMQWLHDSYLKTASEFLDLGREDAKLVYGHEISYVLLLHLGAYSSTILPEAIDLLKKKGFKLVTLEEAESDPVYSEDPDAGMRDPGSLIDQWMMVKQIKYPPHEDKPYKQLESICQ